MHAALRLPAVAGRFYASDASELAADVDRLLRDGATGAPARRARAAVVPHAGYVYSGSVAGATYAQVLVPECVVILAPNHTGRGSRRAVWPRGAFRIPGADVAVDEALAAAVCEHAELEPDLEAHRGEHAIEVELPFLSRRRPDVRIVPICLSLLDLEACRRIGHGIARAIAGSGQDVLIVASTDMSHYVSADEARALDGLALDRLLGLDPDGLYATVVRHRISMCGFVPTTVALIAARELGAGTAELVRYGNSGETSGDFARVVGYAGALLA